MVVLTSLEAGMTLHRLPDRAASSSLGRYAPLVSQLAASEEGVLRAIDEECAGWRSGRRDAVEAASARVARAAETYTALIAIVARHAPMLRLDAPDALHAMQARQSEYRHLIRIAMARLSVTREAGMNDDSGCAADDVPFLMAAE